MSNSIAFTLNEQGDELARKLMLQTTQRFSKATLKENWIPNSAIILIMAVPAAIRLIAPLIDDKENDPSVVAIDSTGTFVTPLLGAHKVANQLAREIAATLGATAVISTASDSSNTPALDAYKGYCSLGNVAQAITLMTSGIHPRILNPQKHLIPLTLAKGESDGSLEILISQNSSLIDDFLISNAPTTRVVLVPKDIVLGVGCSSYATHDELESLLKSSLSNANLNKHSILGIATIDSRKDHPAILGLGYEITSYPADTLSQVPTPNPSAVVESFMQTASVSEAAAILLSGSPSLLAEKAKSETATIAIAKKSKPGRIFVVGLGPGDLSLISPLAMRTIGSMDAIIGFSQYIEYVKQLINPNQLVEPSPIGYEKGRVQRAIQLGNDGYSVAILSSGDPGIYALASLLYEMKPSLDPAVTIEVIPGITAALSSASLLGAPLGHDHCYISLSDLLTPWQSIETKVSAAAKGDFVTVFYNPKSKNRDWQLDAAIKTLAEYRPVECPVGIVRNAYRESQQITMMTLGDFDSESVDMNCIVFVGSSMSYISNDKIITPRGYRLE